MPTWSGTVFTVFTVFVAADAYSRRIVGWRTARACPSSCRWTR
jgi:hypothetical protein